MCRINSYSKKMIVPGQWIYNWPLIFKCGPRLGKFLYSPLPNVIRWVTASVVRVRRYYPKAQRKCRFGPCPVDTWMRSGSNTCTESTRLDHKKLRMWAEFRPNILFYQENQATGLEVCVPLQLKAAWGRQTVYQAGWPEYCSLPVCSI